MDYFESLQKIVEITPKYAHLPLPELLMTVGTECGYYSREETERRLNNVYINEVVKLPDALGYFERNGEYWAWVTNERNHFFIKKEKDATAMVMSFFMSSGNNCKSPYDKGGFRVSIESVIESEGLQ